MGQQIYPKLWQPTLDLVCTICQSWQKYEYGYTVCSALKKAFLRKINSALVE